MLLISVCSVVVGNKHYKLKVCVSAWNVLIIPSGTLDLIFVRCTTFEFNLDGGMMPDVRFDDGNVHILEHKR